MWLVGWDRRGLDDPPPLGLHGSNPRQVSSARQKGRPAGLLERQVELRRRSSGCAGALA